MLTAMAPYCDRFKIKLLPSNKSEIGKYWSYIT
jgi:hypothetical protein